MPTIDIDAAWAYRHKGLFRLFLGSISDLLRGRRLEFRKRLEVVFSKKPDPFDNYDLLNQIHTASPASLRYFFLLGNYGRYDKNHSPQHPAFQALIRRIAAEHPIGIHPSYRSNEDPACLPAEIQILEAISGQTIQHSRQHFLKLHLPETYRRLLAQGIRYDYSMGFADTPGFRAGLAVPFYWYDLECEQTTELQVIPFQVMDGTLRQYMSLDQEAAAEKCRTLLREVREVAGTFSIIWHNSSLSDWNEWSKWRSFY
ncbi:MAG: polysaccharide deacetylase family protein, partial [Phaeodactylibacter sp.]|nr:polysaccharide deacetylase family protein [Phaeodactylibacter sp.]